MPEPALGAVDSRSDTGNKDHRQEPERSPEQPRSESLPDPAWQQAGNDRRTQSHADEHQVSRQVNLLDGAGARRDAGAVHHQDAESQEDGYKGNEEFSFGVHG